MIVISPFIIERLVTILIAHEELVIQAILAKSYSWINQEKDFWKI